jgi:hypothetical protein
MSNVGAERVRNDRIRTTLMLLAFAAIPALSGCVAYGPVGYAAVAPPPYADHGAAYYYDDVVLVFDVAWNGWAVRGHPNHYYYGDHYYRWRGGRWDRSRHFRHGWTRANIGSVPERLHHRRGHRRHRHSADDRRDGQHEARRETAPQDRRDGGRDVARGREGDRRETTLERPEDHRIALGERREGRSEVATAPREDRRGARRDAREARREAPPERRREDHRTAVPERREGHGRSAQTPREERREDATPQRAEGRQSTREGREERRRAPRKQDADEQKAEETAEESAEVARIERRGRSQSHRGRAR